jgi:hypothetical protein
MPGGGPKPPLAQVYATRRLYRRRLFRQRPSRPSNHAQQIPERSRGGGSLSAETVEHPKRPKPRRRLVEPGGRALHG